MSARSSRIPDILDREHNGNYDGINHEYDNEDDDDEHDNENYSN